MKKKSFIFVAAFLVLFAGCASNNTSGEKKTGPVSRIDPRHFTIPKGKSYSYIEYSDSLETAVFEGKEYKLIMGDEFDQPFENGKKWVIFGGYDVGTTEVHSNDGSWLGSKIIGTKPFDKIVIEKPKYPEETVFGEKAYYTEDGVLHMKQIRKKIGNDWHVFVPAFQSMDLIERGVVVEMRYKLPVKGRCTVLHASINKDKACVNTDSDINVKGWSFQQLYFGEFLSGVPNQIRYGASIWLGKSGDSANHDIDYAIADHRRGEQIDYGNDLNVWDDNSIPYYRYDDDFYEWHTATIVYDDEKFANYQDGLKVYEWKWADHPECGLPQDVVDANNNTKKGAGRLDIEYGLSGDWALTNDPDQKAFEKKWIGNFGDTDEIFDFQLDYIRVYKLK